MRSVVLAEEALAENRYEELLRVPALSVGRYRLLAGAADHQKPHTEDEIYIVRSGRAVLRTPADDVPVTAGAVIYVPAGEDHRFVDIEEALDVIVVFAPAEHSNGPGSG